MERNCLVFRNRKLKARRCKFEGQRWKVNDSEDSYFCMDKKCVKVAERVVPVVKVLNL